MNSALIMGIITLVIFILLLISIFLARKYCKNSVLKNCLVILVVLVTLYSIMFSIDYNRVASLKEPVFARENGYMGSMIRYDGLGYKIGLEKDVSTGNISQSMMTMFGQLIVEAITDTNDELNESGTAEYLFNLKTLYIGNNSAIDKLLNALDIRLYGEYTFELKTSQKPYILTIDYNLIYGWGPISNEIMIEKSAILLALIDNADEIHWVLSDSNEIYKITISDLLEKYGDIKEYGKSVKDFKLLLIQLGYYEEDEPITMSISNLTNKGLTLILTNHTNNKFLYGTPYTLQRRKNGKWIEIKQIKDNCAFTAVGYTLKANQTVDEKVNWKYCYGKLSKGQYQITKDFDHIISETEGDRSIFGKKHIISAEFIIK